MRADVYLFEHGFAKSRQNAKVLIEKQSIKIDGKIVTKPALDIDESIDHAIEIVNEQKFVSRGGEKLERALDDFNVKVDNCACLDVGASTGGFTDCLLQRGASIVYAVDSGHNQLDPKISSDSRVISIEKYNARYIEQDDFPIKFDIAVMDVSFISQTFMHKGISSVLKDDGQLIALIKPQFECGKSALNSHGIVKKSVHHLQAINKIIDSAIICGFSCINITRSPFEDVNINREYLIHLQKSPNPQNLITDNKIKQFL